jgi:uncharacterized metal-binding protein YceD (DUF177 family)
MNQLIDPKNDEGKIIISKFPINSPQTYELDKSITWVRDILVELNENAENKLPEQYLEDSFLNIHLKVEKKFKGSYGEYLILSGNLETQYFTQCVRTLEEMRDHLELDFKACILDVIHSESEELQDQIEIFIDNDLYDLHFYENRSAMIKELIHELIYLNINKYPVSDADAELPWAKDIPTTKQ